MCLCYSNTMPIHNAHAIAAKRTKTTVDKICYAASVFMPATAIPQIYQLYTTQDAGSLSLLMWMLYIVGMVPFLLFGILHKEKQLIVLNVLWMIASVMMIFGILLFS
jgi:MtN3 and saliva related transmembrane protein